MTEPLTEDAFLEAVNAHDGPFPFVVAERGSLRLLAHAGGLQSIQGAMARPLIFSDPGEAVAAWNEDLCEACLALPGHRHHPHCASQGEEGRDG